MSEVQNRSGGRGGSSRSANADNSDAPSFEEGEIGQMRKKYSDTLPTLKELFPDWKDEDLIFALEDSNGELEDAIVRITEGNVSQWGEVKKTTDRTRPKPKEAQNTQTESTPVSVRGGRGRGGFEGRGRARGDRGRGGRGGRAGAQTTNGTRTTTSAAEPATAIPATEPVAPKVGGEVEQPTAGGNTESTETKTSVIPEGTKKGWASLFAKPAPPPPQKQPPAAAPAPAPAPEKPAEPAVEQQKAPEPAPAPVPVPAPAAAPAPAASQKTPVAKPAQPAIPAIPNVTSKTLADDLTETNLERIPDVSAPAPTATAASTVGSALDPSATANVTPSRAPHSGLPGSALKHGRTPGFQRRVMEQQQAVVMPGNHAVDRAAVQFGSMGLNGDAVDIDENREEAETRAQPPQHSPVAPRASLPPSTQGPADGTPVAARPAPGLPPVPQASAAESFGDFSRFADPFSQPQPQIQEPFANQAPAQPAVTTGADYSSFYASDQRFPYYNNYGNYGQTQDAAARAGAGFGVSAAEAQPQVPTTQPPGRYGPVDATNSGHNTPNPTLPATTQTPAVQHMPGQAAHGYGYSYPYYNNNPHYASYMNQMNQHQYGRNRPMYDDARRYEEQQQQQHYGMPHNTQYGYGSQYGPYGGKGGMYGQPHAFSYDHSSSPANAGTFNQGVPGRDSVYGRTGSAQPSDTQQSAASTNAFGSGMSDVFVQPQAGFGRNPTVTQQPPVSAEETKGFDASKTGGPSPSLAQANRPGSATNSVPGQPQAQTGLPPLQGQQGQQAFGTYPDLNPQYGGLGGLGHQGAGSQTHQASGYSNYGAGFGNYYGNSGRGGWGGNYGH
ncbi:Ubiquitin system component Cue [Penicillium hetheringtonii]|uniref:RNA polymerase II degradation factor 1 n=1 Tax=Penicillium hetheringtonii TaxID=911720 RepID=A0AAD6GW33_9EURO|nr:Ubiquitin system component Cue [Penicillium hetheringtonii]